jgi:hypothetical protein
MPSLRGRSDMTVGFLRRLSSADTVQPPMDIAVTIGSDVVVPLRCEESLFRAAVPNDAVGYQRMVIETTCAHLGYLRMHSTERR